MTAEDPRDYGLTAASLRAAADRLYAPDDPRLEPIKWTHDTQVEYGQVRSRLRALADALDRLCQLCGLPITDDDLAPCDEIDCERVTL